MNIGHPFRYILFFCIIFFCFKIKFRLNIINLCVDFELSLFESLDEFVLMYINLIISE